MYLTAKAIRHLNVVLKSLNFEDEDLIELKTMPFSKRPCVVIGPRNEYGEIPRLVLDDAEFWNSVL